ncbi:CRC domain-containing protein TSO1, partial [Sesbania bispinosa]
MALVDAAYNLRKLACSALEVIVSYEIECNFKPMKMVKLSEPITSLFPQRGSGNLPVTGSKPSGIGLHLNSIINAMPPGRCFNYG